MRDVAALANVSHKTVSRVINDSPHVRPELRQRVHDAIQQLHYVPNLAARALAGHRTKTIGVLTVNPVETTQPQLADLFTLERTAHDHGYGITLATTADLSEDGLRRALDELVTRGLDGLVLDLPDRLELDPAAINATPSVTRTEATTKTSRQTTVSVDDVAAGRVVARYLLGLGHTHTAHLGGPLGWQAARRRRAGWVAGHRESGLNEPPAYEGDWSAQSGYTAGRQLLHAHPDVTAVFAANDQMAMGLLHAAEDAGRSVPGELAVVGMNDVPEGRYLAVPLTTVSVDRVALARRTIEELIHLIDGSHPSANVLLAGHLVIRSSSAPFVPHRKIS